MVIVAAFVVAATIVVLVLDNRSLIVVLPFAVLPFVPVADSDKRERNR